MWLDEMRGRGQTMGVVFQQGEASEPLAGVLSRSAAVGLAVTR